MKFPYKLIDLSHTLDSRIPTWNGGCGFNHNLHIDYSDCDGEVKFRVMKLDMNAGIGTHIDAPSHCFNLGKCIDELDINDLCMPCFVIDVEYKAHERYSLTQDDILEFESKHTQITKGSCVMIKTGWSKHWNDPNKYHNSHVFPSVSHSAAELLLDLGVQALGIDTLSADRPEDDFMTHKLFLGADRVLIENVANLDAMPATGAFVVALPIKIKSGTEAPTRLVGMVRHD